MCFAFALWMVLGIILLFALLRFARERERILPVWLGFVLNKKQDFAKLRVLGDV
jgi:hypothetical protein